MIIFCPSQLLLLLPSVLLAIPDHGGHGHGHVGPSLYHAPAPPPPPPPPPPAYHPPAPHYKVGPFYLESCSFFAQKLLFFYTTIEDLHLYCSFKKEEPHPYHYEYGVHDDYHGTNFNAGETSDCQNVKKMKNETSGFQNMKNDSSATTR